MMKELKLKCIKGGAEEATGIHTVGALVFSQDASGVLRATQPFVVKYHNLNSPTTLKTINSTVEFRLERSSTESRSGLIRQMVKVTCSYPQLTWSDTGDPILGTRREFSFHTVYTIGKDAVATYRLNGQDKAYIESLFSATGWVLNACSSAYGAGAFYGLPEAAQGDPLYDKLRVASLPIYDEAAEQSYFAADENNVGMAPLVACLPSVFRDVSHYGAGVMPETVEQGASQGTSQGVRSSDPITVALQRSVYPDTETIRALTVPRFVAGTADVDTDLFPVMELHTVAPATP